jgi:hypothetical protein
MLMAELHELSAREREAVDPRLLDVVEYRKSGLSLNHIGCARYGVMYKTVLDTSVPLGPGRDPDLAFRIAVDAALDQLIDDLALPARRLDPGNAADGADRVLQEVVRHR